MILIGLTLSVLGFAFYAGLFVWFKKLLTKYLTPPYSRYDLLDISNKSVSASHAIISSLAGLIITSSVGRDLRNDTHWVTNTFAWFGFPYFIYDLWCMFYVYQHLPANQGVNVFNQLWNFVSGQPMITVHHLVLAFVAFPLTVLYRRNLGDYFVGCFYLAELSTPFVSMRAIMSKRGMKGSIWYVINGMLMMITFFICRVCVFPYLYYTYSVYANMSIPRVIISIPKKCNIASLSFFTMQTYWFTIMVRGAVKLLVRGQQRPLSSEAMNAANNNHNHNSIIKSD